MTVLYSKMRYAILLALAACAAASVTGGRGDSGLSYADDGAVALTGAGSNCQCKCNCQFTAEDPCNMDFIILLDAASCVRNVWEEMILRINSLARGVNHNHPMGGKKGGPMGQSRFSVITYAETANRAIKLEDNLNFEEFSAALDGLSTINRGSFLDKGLQELYKYSEENVEMGRKQVVIVVTNGKSHPDANVDKDRLAGFAMELNEQMPGDMEAFYINTIVPINLDAYSEDDGTGNFLGGSNTFASVDAANKDSYECPGCGWNEKLFLDIRGVGRVGSGGPLSLDNIVSKVHLENRILNLVDNACPTTETRQVCTDCECTCGTQVGPMGPRGHPGPAGPNGPDGKCGASGKPGRDGEVGRDGPNGANGCDAMHGNPGHHGKPGLEGDCGVVGAGGVQGVRGAPGPDGEGVGLAGPRGYPGPQGKAGGRGRDGTPGVDGVTGAVGHAGMAGEPGSPGKAGLPGYCGKDGTRGPPGPKGYAGANGADGEMGPVGDAGRVGAVGKDGHAGAQGSQGPCGVDGEDGAVGPRGVKGMPGPTGARGGSGANIVNIENYIRGKVSAILDGYLVYESRGRGYFNEYFCQCKAFSLYEMVLRGLSKK